MCVVYLKEYVNFMQQFASSNEKLFATLGHSHKVNKPACEPNVGATYNCIHF